jgi:hypothetical protein
MTSEEQEHMAKLVKQIEVEQDQHKFIQLVEELTDLLDGKKRRLENKTPSAPNAKLQHEPG